MTNPSAPRVRPATRARSLRRRAARPVPRAGPVGPRAGRHRGPHVQPAQRCRPVRGGCARQHGWRERGRGGGARSDRRPRRMSSSSPRRPPSRGRSSTRRAATSGPDRRRRPPADRQRPRVDALLVGRWPVGVLHPDDPRDGQWPTKAREAYQLDVPDSCAIRADGSAGPERLKTGRIKRRDGHLCVLDPPARRVAGRVTGRDHLRRPNPDDKTPVLQFYDPADEITDPGLPTDGVLGYQDPEWRPTAGCSSTCAMPAMADAAASVIVRLNPGAAGQRRRRPAGTLYPAYSPDGRYIAATRP